MIDHHDRYDHDTEKQLLVDGGMECVHRKWERRL